MKSLFNLYDYVRAIADACDFVDTRVVNHHRMVAYLALMIGENIGLTETELQNIYFAGLMHDIGAFSLKERLELIENETPGANDHAFIGAGVLSQAMPFKEIAEIIRYHHVPWNSGEGAKFLDKEVPTFSHIIYIADRIVVMLKVEEDILKQTNEIYKKIELNKNAVFISELVEAFFNIKDYEYIWLNLIHIPNKQHILKFIGVQEQKLDLDDILKISETFSKVIDFRSPFTANHSSGVAAVSEKMAEIIGFSEDECKQMRIAGNLHDLGKLAVNNDILEKPGRLNNTEFNFVRSHTYFTFKILEKISGFETINTLASFHDEKLNGRGCPFHLKANEISLGSRIMALADVFVAITENRPYRKGMEKEKVIEILNNMAKNNFLCSYCVSTALKNYGILNEIRIKAQKESFSIYKSLI